MRFTVFTATYNRARTLRRTYESLCRQTHRDFEWLVVDDGSSDATDALVAGWQREGRIEEIRYLYQDNGGKHTAWRRALEHARGPLLVEVDSDDELTPDALAVFDRHWTRLERRADRGRFLDVRALCLGPDGAPLSRHRFPADVWEGNLLELIFCHRLLFEQVTAWHLERLRSAAPVPERFAYDDRARNFSEGIRWARAARHHDTLFLNAFLRVYHFDGDNSYCRGFNLGRPDRFYNNIVADRYFVQENLDHFRSWPQHFVKAMIRYTSNSLVVGTRLARQLDDWQGAGARALWLATLPAGAATFALKKLLLGLGYPRQEW